MHGPWVRRWIFLGKSMYNVHWTFINLPALTHNAGYVTVRFEIVPSRVINYLARARLRASFKTTVVFFVLLYSLWLYNVPYYCWFILATRIRPYFAVLPKRDWIVREHPCTDYTFCRTICRNLVNYSNCPDWNISGLMLCYTCRTCYRCYTYTCLRPRQFHGQNCKTYTDKTYLQISISLPYAYVYTKTNTRKYRHVELLWDCS